MLVFTEYMYYLGRSRSASSSRSSRRLTDDEDFVVDDEASELDAMKGDSESELELKTQKSKYKPENASKHPKVKSGVPPPNGPQDFLLTAAEQRARGKKTDKVEKEEPFSFLLDIRDVSRLLLIKTLLFMLTVCSRKTVIGLGMLTTTPKHCTSHRVLGKYSLHLKSR